MGFLGKSEISVLVPFLRAHFKGDPIQKSKSLKQSLTVRLDTPLLTKSRLD